MSARARHKTSEKTKNQTPYNVVLKIRAPFTLLLSIPHRLCCMSHQWLAGLVLRTSSRKFWEGNQQNGQERPFQERLSELNMCWSWEGEKSPGIRNYKCKDPKAEKNRMHLRNERPVWLRMVYRREQCKMGLERIRKSQIISYAS